MFPRLLLVGVALASAIVGVMMTGSTPSHAAEPLLWVTHGLDRIPEQGAVPDNAKTQITLSAAKNEFEAAQIVIHGGNTGLRGVNLLLTDPLTNAEGAALPEASVVCYREHYLRVTAPSGGHGTPGRYPDALVPFRHPFSGEPLGTENIPAAPFDVAAGDNQPVYVEFYVPPGVEPGTYNGAIRVVLNNDIYFAEVPISLRVWNFELPARPSHRTSFQTYDASHWLGPAKYYGYGYRSPEHFAVATAADELLLAHRVTPSSPIGTSFDVDDDGNLIPDAEQEERLKSWITRPEVSSFALGFSEDYPFENPADRNREKAVNYLRTAYEWFDALNVTDKVFALPGDEPSSTRELRRVRDLTKVVRDAHPRSKAAVTMTISSERARDYLFGSVNAPIVHYGLFDPLQASIKQSAGDEVWTYTAVVEEPNNPSPYWQLDFPLLNYRVVPWINYRYGVEGFLYWTTALWGTARKKGTSPWSDACTYDVGWACFNGEGLLLYPGKEVNYVVPEGAYGRLSKAAVYGVVPSLRLKAFRDGMEDFEYLVMAVEADSVSTEALLYDVACSGDRSGNCFTEWNPEPGAMIEAREQLGKIIERAVAEAPGSETESITEDHRHVRHLRMDRR